MTRFARGLVYGLALTLAIGTAGSARQDKDKKEKPPTKEVLAARKAVLGLAKMVEDGKDDKAIAAKILEVKKENDELLDLMTVYKFKEKHGLGWGDNPKRGLERAVNDLARGQVTNPISVARLKKERADLLRLSYVSIVLADVAKHYFPGNSKGKTKKDWDKWSDEQKSSSQDLLKAIKANDGKAAKAAVKKLQDACLGCHEGFKNTGG